MKKILNIVLPVLACFIVGFTASNFQTEAIANWYPALNKSPLTPPNIAFPIAWSILYLLMGISIGLVLNSRNWRKRSLITLFIIQLVFNFTWSISFFYFQNPLLGLINILLLDVLVLYYIIRAYKLVKASAWLFIPYLIWILFATYLNGYIFINN
ncbi:TspO/MBR family protein [Dysgonomonas macrotermitis]|uniref:TspO and MBR related proteins n=1 Tax=Dysgonomonas macrotermitis TaxID=1346286 RepID=A0A1M5DPW9_9BACT|nr:TspO/MBR family protein [Dysgonomonas macrotermitis]SHF69078.1 TspO and MBR related proteins [Dysgonomonas macrotermitis]